MTDHRYIAILGKVLFKNTKEKKVKIKRTKKFVSRVYFSSVSFANSDVEAGLDDILLDVLHNVPSGIEATVFIQQQFAGKATFKRGLSVVGQDKHASQTEFNMSNTFAFEIHATRRRGFGVPQMRSLVEDSLDEIRTSIEFASVDYIIEEKEFFTYEPQINEVD